MNIREENRAALNAWWKDKIIDPLIEERDRLISAGVDEKEANAIVQAIFETDVLEPTRGLRGGL